MASAIAHPPDKLKGLRKLPTLAWRTRTEATRVAAAITAYLASFPSRKGASDPGAGRPT
jgi:hypothetical protein